MARRGRHHCTAPYEITFGTVNAAINCRYDGELYVLMVTRHVGPTLPACFGAGIATSSAVKGAKVNAFWPPVLLGRHLWLETRAIPESPRMKHDAPHDR